MLVLFELARRLNERLELPDICDLVVKHLRRIVPSSLFVFYIHDSNAAELVCAFASGEHSSMVAGLRIPLGQRLTGWVGAHRHTISNSDPILDLGDTARSIVPRLRSCLKPLVVADSLVGVLSLYSEASQAFSQEHQRIIEVIGRQISPALLHAISPEDKFSSIGGPLPSGAAAVEMLESLLRSNLQPTELCLILVRLATKLDPHRGSPLNADIERRIIQCIRQQVRSSDIVVRDGLSHFVIAQLNMDSSLASVTASRIRQALEAELVGLTLQSSIKVGVSVSQMPTDGRSVEELISAAKHRLDVRAAGPNSSPERAPKSIH